MARNINSLRGFSLIEVLIFVSILGIFFVIALSTTVSALRDMKFNEHKILATRYAEDLMEWLKSQKEKEFNAFVAYDTSSGTGTTYCFNSVSINTWPAAGDCSSVGLNPAIYKRSVIIKRNGGATTSSSVELSVTVEWDELGVTKSVPVNSTLYIYE